MGYGRGTFLVAALAAGLGCSAPGSDDQLGQGGAGGGFVITPAVTGAGGAAGAPAPGDGGAGAGGAAGPGTPPPCGGSGGGLAGGRGGSGTDPVGFWGEIAAPPGIAGEVIAGAWSAGLDDIFFTTHPAQDGGGTTTRTASRVLRWTAAGGWSEELVVDLDPPWLPAVSVSGNGPDDVWAAGNNHIFHRDAQGWQMVPDEEWSPEVADAPAGSAFIAVAARDGEAWFLSPKFLLHRDASGWSALVLHDPPEPRTWMDPVFTFATLWLDGAGGVWVSGTTDTPGNTMDPAFTEHYTGGAWVREDLGLYLSEVDAAWPTADGGFWYAAYTVESPGHYVFAPVRRFDGHGYVDGITTTGDDKRLTIASLWGRADDDVWAAGSYSSWPDNVPALFHYDGGQWTELRHAPTTGKGYVLVTGDAHSTWVVTDQPRFFRFRPPVR